MTKAAAVDLNRKALQAWECARMRRNKGQHALAVEKEREAAMLDRQATRAWREVVEA